MGSWGLGFRVDLGFRVSVESSGVQCSGFGCFPKVFSAIAITVAKGIIMVICVSSASPRTGFATLSQALFKAWGEVRCRKWYIFLSLGAVI